MINITKDKFLKNRIESIAKINRKNKRIGKYIERNKAIILLLASFGLLAISNGFLVYNFFRILSKI